MKRNYIFAITLFSLFLVSCEEEPSKTWVDKDSAPEKQLQVDCDGFKESMNWDCDCFKKVTKEMFPDLQEYYKIRKDETKYAEQNDAWFNKLDEKCKQKEASTNSK